LGYILQTLAEGYLLNAGRSLLVALVLGDHRAELHYRDVPRHQAAEEEVRRTAREFWDNIAAGKMPKPDYGRDGSVIAELYPPDVTLEAPVDLQGDNRLTEVLEQRAALKRVLKASEDECAALDAEVVEKLAGSTSAIANGWKIRRTTVFVKERL